MAAAKALSDKERETKMSSPQFPPARTRVQSSAETDKDKAKAEAEAAGSLEVSLLQLLRNHHNCSLKLREQTERAKKESINNAKRVSDLLVDALNGGVQESYTIEKRIELEIRALTATIGKFMKQTDQWHAATHSVNTAVKVLSSSSLFVIL